MKNESEYKDERRLTLLGLMTVACQQYDALQATEAAICRLMKVPPRSEMPDYNSEAYDSLSRRDQSGSDFVGDAIYSYGMTPIERAADVVKNIGMPD